VIAVRPLAGPVYRVTTGYQVGTSNRQWQVIDTYQTGVGYTDLQENLPCSDDVDWVVRSDKFKLDTLVNTQFKYTGKFTTQEKEHIEWCWEQARDGTHFEWGRFFGKGTGTMESVVVIPGPFYVRACASFDLDYEYNEISLDIRSYLRKIALVA